MKQKKLAAITLVAATAVLGSGVSVYALPAVTSTDYTITIPATLEVANAGWNATDGITAQVKSGDTFDSSKKLTVTASSAHEWNLKSGENAIAYKMASATEQEKSYADATATTSLEISAEDLNIGNYIAPFGIVVEDYSDKPAGEYKDTVTFTASVEDAVTAPTLAGVTLTDGMIIEPHCNVDGGDNWAQFKYVAADDKFVPNFNSYDDAYSKAQGDLMQPCADQWAYSVFEYNEEPDTNFYLTQSGNTVHLRADDGINMTVIDLQLDFDNMTYTQSYKQWYNEKSGSFTSIKIGDTTITASQMTAQ